MNEIQSIKGERLGSDTRIQEYNTTQEPVERCLHPSCSPLVDEYVDEKGQRYRQITDIEVIKASFDKGKYKSGEPFTQKTKDALMELHTQYGAKRYRLVV